MPFGGDSLRQLALDIIFVEKNLSLQIVVFNEVSVDDSNLADTSSNQRGGDYGAQRPTPNHHHHRPAESRLSFLAYATEDHLP